MKAIKTLLILCAAVLCLASCKKDVDMTLSQKNLFENADIRKIEVSDAWEVTVVGDAANTYVEVEYSAYLQNYLDIKMEGTKLEIGFTETLYPVNNSVYRATVHLGQLQEVEADDAAVIHFNGDFSGSQLNVNLGGASVCNNLSWTGTNAEIKLEDASVCSGFQYVGSTCKVELEDASQLNGEIQASEQIDIDLKDASRLVNKGGETVKTDIKLQDASFLNMIETQVNQMHVDLSSGSEATVNVVSLIEGSLSEASTLYYKGNPQIDVDCTDNSSIIPL